MTGHRTQGYACRVVGLQLYVHDAPHAPCRIFSSIDDLAMRVTATRISGNGGGREYALSVRHSSASRSSGGSSIGVSLAKRATWLRSRGTARAIPGRTVGSSVRPGGEITCTGRVRWLAQPLETQGLVLHSTGRRESVGRTANVRSRPVGAYLHPSRRHTVRSAA